MDKWFDNKDKKYKRKYKEPDLDNYKPEIEYNSRRNWGLIWAIIWIALIGVIVILAINGYGVAFIIIPFPLWMIWRSLKIFFHYN